MIGALEQRWSQQLRTWGADAAAGAVGNGCIIIEEVVVE
jgi:hypothetical protein